MRSEFVSICCCWLLTGLRVGCSSACDSFSWTLIDGRRTIVWCWTGRLGPSSRSCICASVEPAAWCLVKRLSSLARISASSTYSWTSYSTATSSSTASTAWSSWTPSSSAATTRCVLSLLASGRHLSQSFPVALKEVGLTRSHSDALRPTLNTSLTSEIWYALISTAWRKLAWSSTIESAVRRWLLPSQPWALAWRNPAALDTSDKVVSHMRRSVTWRCTNSSTCWSCWRLPLLVASRSFIGPGHPCSTSWPHVARRGSGSTRGINPYPILSCSTSRCSWWIPWVLGTTIRTCSIVSWTTCSVTISISTILSPIPRTWTSCSITSTSETTTPLKLFDPLDCRTQLLL